ncbi:hypothetical protein R70006_05035 [Paraburkholderia domus]|uniref:hypothetical protein n=1 Tax=Paraburkholderia domus TaxID=2793075 RepID=UPI00191287C5|nr:hypothetical protein [Paraburkholderia domus]MBK5051728.1 hypothetical protein [Burkholderia sp. R-70006]CAE6795103.1 hypothetical protein R70006_05035 [Paraburkholderia domus]
MNSTKGEMSLRLEREAIVVALVSRGEDPSAGRVDAVHARIDPSRLEASEHAEDVLAAVDAACVTLDAAPAMATVTSVANGLMFGTIIALPEQVGVLSAMGIVLGDYDPEHGRFYACADPDRIDREAAGEEQFDLSRLRLRDSLRFGKDDYPASVGEIETEIVWCEFMLHAPAGCAFQRSPRALVDIGNTLHSLRQDLLEQTGSAVPYEPRKNVVIGDRIEGRSDITGWRYAGNVAEILPPVAGMAGAHPRYRLTDIKCIRDDKRRGRNPPADVVVYESGKPLAIRAAEVQAMPQGSKEAQYQWTQAVQSQLGRRYKELFDRLVERGFVYDSTTARFARDGVSVWHIAGAPDIQYRLDLLQPYSRFIVKTPETCAATIDDRLDLEPEEVIAQILGEVADRVRRFDVSPAVEL